MSDRNSSPSDGHSVTRMIQDLKAENSEAAGAIWNRFFSKLLPMARARLRGLADRSVDEEDLLVSVFDRFFVAVSEDRFARLNDRDDLWQILLMLTDHRVSEQYRHSNAQKRGGGQVMTLDAAPASEASWREIADGEPSPEFVAAFNENLARAIDRLQEEKTRNVAIMKLEGFENREIAERLGIGLSSVERKMRVIREKWRDIWDV